MMIKTPGIDYKFGGFTLVEMLIVIGILGATVGASLIFLTSVFRGTNQANVGAEVKQNGQAVLGSLEGQIRNAIDAQSGDNGKYLKLTRPSAVPLHIKCFRDSTDSNPKTENGWIGSVSSNALEPSESSYLPLTNKDKVAGVDINNCSLSVIAASSGGSKPAIVTISFVVNQGIGAPSRADFLANEKFETTVSLRQF